MKCSQHDGENPCRLCLRAGRSKDQCVLEKLPPRPRRTVRPGGISPMKSSPVPALGTPIASVSPTTALRPSSLSREPGENFRASPHVPLYRQETLLQDIPEVAIMEAVEMIPRVFPDLSFIHVADFIHQLRTSRKRIVVLKLASILALAARISPSLLADPKRSRCLSQQLSAYTQQNLWPGLVQEPDTDTMHCLLLTAQYEWGDGNGFAAWMYSGETVVFVD